MDTGVVNEAAVARALRRSSVYRVLAQAFRYPADDEVPALRTSVAAARASAPAGTADELARLGAALTAATANALREDHAATFGHVVSPDCPLYETACEGVDAFRQPQTLADLHGFYRAFGLEPAAGARERADHLAIELEFMHYLTYREAYALAHHGAAKVEQIREAQRRFLERHLGRWAPALGRAVAERSAGPLGAAGWALERFLIRELADHHAVPETPTVPAAVSAAVDAGAEDDGEDNP